jgi:hypothetical protein
MPAWGTPECLHPGTSRKRVPESHREKFLADLRADLNNLAPFSIAGMGISVRELEVWQQGKC